MGARKQRGVQEASSRRCRVQGSWQPYTRQEACLPSQPSSSKALNSLSLRTSRPNGYTDNNGLSEFLVAHQEGGFEPLAVHVYNVNVSEPGYSTIESSWPVLKNIIIIPEYGYRAPPPREPPHPTHAFHARLNNTVHPNSNDAVIKFIALLRCLESIITPHTAYSAAAI